MQSRAVLPDELENLAADSDQQETVRVDKYDLIIRNGTVATAGVALDRLLETVANIVCALLYVSVFSLTHSLGVRFRRMLGILECCCGAHEIPDDRA